MSVYPLAAKDVRLSAFRNVAVSTQLGHDSLNSMKPSWAMTYVTRATDPAGPLALWHTREPRRAQITTLPCLFSTTSSLFDQMSPWLNVVRRHRACILIRRHEGERGRGIRWIDQPRRSYRSRLVVHYGCQGGIPRILHPDGNPMRGRNIV